MELLKEGFGETFHWGVATAACQIEGAYDADGKGMSIWDRFSQKKGNIYQRQHPQTSTDHYNRYRQDILLMKSMHIPNYRFSIAWTRIFPNGTGAVNQQGVDFYNRLIDFCLQQGIEPWITLYHWDLPDELQKKGGWVNRDIVNWFLAYTSFCVDTFGDRVKYWMILNEPMVFTGAGYFLGIHAPGKKGLSNFLAAAHHAVLCQAEGGRLAKSLNGNLQVGTTFSCSLIQAFRNTPADQKAQIRMDALLNRMFIEPLLGLSYPLSDLKVLRRMEEFVKDGDEKKMPFTMDFIGIQNYTRELVKYDFFTPFLQAGIVKADKRKVERTAMNWEVYPASIYHMLKKYAAYPAMPQMIVTESGAAFPDEVVSGQVNDSRRTEYIQEHLRFVGKAREEGAKVNGYFVWSFMDNFEWAEGYRPRFGLVYIDFVSQERIIKASGKWYSRFLEGRPG